MKSLTTKEMKMSEQVKHTPISVCPECQMSSYKIGKFAVPHRWECKLDSIPYISLASLTEMIRERIDKCETCANGVCPMCLNIKSLLTSLGGEK